MYRESVEDFRKKYEQTFIFYKGKLVWVDSFTKNEETGEIVIVFFTDGKTCEQDKFKPDEVAIVMFDSHFFNGISFKEKAKTVIAATRFFRVGRRQNRRSLCSDTGTITTPYYEFNRINPIFPSYLQWPQWGWELINKMCHPFYPSYLEALDLTHKYFSVALSPNFAISLSPISTENFIISSLFGFVAEATTSTIFVRHPPVHQEIIDYVNRSGIKLEVKLEPYYA